MFRNPRHPSTSTTTPALGRAPPPPGSQNRASASGAPPSAGTRMVGTRSRAAKPAENVLPTIGRQGIVGGAKKTAAKGGSGKGNGNGNILSFFKKAEKEEEGLFVGGERGVVDGFVGELEVMEEREEEGERFNESEGSVKRRRVDCGEENGKEEGREVGGHSGVCEEAAVQSEGKKIERRRGPFEEEDEEDEDEDEEKDGVEQELVKAEQPMEPVVALVPVDDGQVKQEPRHEDEEAADQTSAVAVSNADDRSRTRPPLVKEETSYGPGMEEFQDFEDMNDFDEDLFEEGDEFVERRYMEEQARLEDEHVKEEGETPLKDEEDIPDTAADAPTCPLCSISMAGISEQDAGVHVNNCLDGNPSPLPERKKPPNGNTQWLGTDTTSGSTPIANRFKRPERAPKPGQADPFTQEAGANGGSAFNKLMSGHAEDAAWAEAAAAEHSSRGKPSYQRTCPFYKIMPGLFICVDAFRYGAVQGCKAYFLSHFHSDHYVGLTSSWHHGPIYCSKVTGNLVRQQLRVDPKFVVDLEFDETVEVPGTKGVNVTMIPANHCPGSSLYLFEKVIGKKFNGDPKLQRILHCGDFRACRAHVEHPLLMPDVQDKVTGKTKEQKIDVCYLDTTYLNPKYAFPSQAHVIKACADMCVSLSKHTVDEEDGWEKMKRQRAGEGMVKFVRKESQPEVKQEESQNEDPNDIKLEKNPKASQQILRTPTLPNHKDGRGRLLVVVGTYSIGKERICLGIARALDSKIYAPPSKQRIVAALEDPELNALMTSDPRAAQVHMTPLFEIRADTLDDYLKDYFPHFTRAVGFRPSGWNYRPPTTRFLESPSVQTVLSGENWRSPYGMKDLVPQRGSTSRASCFGVPYSEHSSFRELTVFVCALRIERVIPTVNVGSARSRGKMKEWCERWAVERRKNGEWCLPEGPL